MTTELLHKNRTMRFFAPPRPSNPVRFTIGCKVLLESHDAEKMLG
jgi:hypothetical protein